MSSDWPYVRLGEFCIKIGSGATPSGGSSVYSDNGEVCLIRSQNIHNFGFKSDGLVFINAEAANKLRNVVVEPNDVLLNITGDSVARVCLAKKEHLPARVNQHVAIVRPDENEFDPRYLCYQLSSPKLQAHLLSIAAVGATRNALTKGMIENLEVIKPPLSVQKEIAEVLESVDKKIELNRQINQTLEQIAQAMFKSWFVDFEPTRAKIAAKEAGGDQAAIEQAAMCAISGKTPDQLNLSPPETLAQLKATAALFPDALVDSELGEIPEGWEVSFLEDIVEIGSAKRIFAGDYQDSGIPFFRGKEITELANGNISEPEVFINKEKFEQIREKYGAPKEDDILLTSVGTIGNTYLVRKDDSFYFKDGNLTWIRRYKKTHIPYYLKIWFDVDIGRAAIEGIKIGSTQQAITISSINKIKILMPTSDIHMAFNMHIRSNFDSRNLNFTEIKTLGLIRDKLLPRLLSGKLLNDSR